MPGDSDTRMPPGTGIDGSLGNQPRGSVFEHNLCAAHSFVRIVCLLPPDPLPPSPPLFFRRGFPGISAALCPLRPPHFNPPRMHAWYSALHRPAHAVCSAQYPCLVLGDHAWYSVPMLIGGCDLMVCPIRGFRPAHLSSCMTHRFRPRVRIPPEAVQLRHDGQVNAEYVATCRLYIDLPYI